MNQNTYTIRNVLVLYVGGTIGMHKNDKGVLIPKPNSFLHAIKHHYEMHDVGEALDLSYPLGHDELILPNVDSFKVIYQIKEYNPLLDSSNMTIKEWIRIARDVKDTYEKYNGFIILHGTDTLAYTASALSFMLEGLQKPVILTGSQIPFYERRTDAKDNFLSALILASCYNIPEVCIFFDHKLLRGNRTSKLHANGLGAFNSPNYHVLGEVGNDICVHYNYIKRKPDEDFMVNTNLNGNVGTIFFFPTITANMVESFLQPPLEGVVIQTYGTGNIPTDRHDIVEILRNAIRREIIVINVTQCLQGSVSIVYETGRALDEMGIVTGHDMTIEAALTKLMFVLGKKNLSYLDKLKLLTTDLKGELTEKFV